MEIVVYTAHLSSPKDRDLTLVHEYLHASNDIILDIEDSNESVENEAEITLECWPGIAQFIAFVNGKNLPEKGKKL